MSWVWQVLEYKGVNAATLSRLRNLYSEGITVPVVNNTPLPAIYDKRGSLRQGGTGSMEWFAFGIDPLLLFLEKNLTGILVSSSPISGPAKEGEQFPLHPYEERFKAMAYCDDVKPAICSLNEFLIADEGAALFERSAGTKLHRDPLSNKCKFLPLGKWRVKLKQEDIPTPYMRLTDTLDMVGVQLCSTWSKTRASNGATLQKKISSLIGSWRAGKFMPLILRPRSANIFALSKVWFRCASVNLREADFSAINSSLKKWVYADLLLKPDERTLFRPIWYGGLGLASVKHKSIAYLIRTFMELAANSNYHQSPFLSRLYRVHILQEDTPCPPSPSYYSNHFYQYILSAKNDGKNIIDMTTKQWYHYLIDKELLKEIKENGTEIYCLCRSERLFPNIDWRTTWGKIRYPFLSSNTATFLWKLLHELLPTEERLSMTVGNIPSTCRFECADQVATLMHCFFKCHLTNEVGSWVLNFVHNACPSVQEEKVLKLDFSAGNSLFWVTANTLQYLWNSRVSKKKVNLHSCIAHLKIEAFKLSDTTHEHLVSSILEIIEPEDHQV